MLNLFKLNKFLSFLLTLSVFVLAYSCGEDNSYEYDSTPQEEQIPEQGVHRATLIPINTNVSFDAFGEALITIAGDQITVKIDAFGTSASTTHIQNIFIGPSCPTSSADVNGDFIVDVLEATATSGQILIPLDGDLESQISGNTTYPTSDAAGYYTYNTTGSFTKMLEDLRVPDEDLSDPYVKLVSGESLSLTGRVLVIHGVPDSTLLPDSVATISGVSKNASLPIACGVIQKISSSP